MYRGPGRFQQPENALKRADELVAVGQPQAALETLHEVVTSRRFRVWQQSYQKIMMRHVDLCVELKKGRMAKEGLMSYRNSCQNENVKSLEEVIKHLLDESSRRAEEAQATVQASLESIDDLDVDATPEDIMLSYVTQEESKDRTDRELVAPWFKFLWESYRSMLEILRNNAKLEALYAMVATRALRFCLQYQRSTEFRRLCDILRNHLKNLDLPQRRNMRQEMPDLTKPDTSRRYLETRFEQLRVAAELGMWQEAFRSIEDIFNLIAISQKSGGKVPTPALMATYYLRMTQIFRMSGSMLYLGFAWFKLYVLFNMHLKTLAQEELSTMSSAVVLAAISILPFDRQLETRATDPQLDQDRMVRMANLLGVPHEKHDVAKALSREALMREIRAKGLLQVVPKEVKEIFDLIEGTFDPLGKCKRLAPLLDKLESLDRPMDLGHKMQVDGAALANFRKPLMETAVLSTLLQLKQVYSSMRIEAFKELVPFMSFREVEHVIVDAHRCGYIQCRIDHKEGIVTFGPAVHTVEEVAGVMSGLAEHLHKALLMAGVVPDQARLEAHRDDAVARYVKAAAELNHAAGVRKREMDRRKEAQELALAQQMRQEREAREMERMEREREEMRRQEEERLRRERERLLAEQEAREQEEARQLALQRGRTVALGEKLDKNELLREEMEERMEKHKRLLEKLHKLERTMDHVERARREVEAPKIEAFYAARREEDKVFFEEDQRKFLEAHRAAWERDLTEKERLARAVGPAEAFRADVMAAREAEFEELQAEREERVAEERARRREEVLLARKKAYVQRLRREEEERVQKEEEEARRRHEEELRARGVGGAAAPATGPGAEWQQVGARPADGAAAAGKFVPSRRTAAAPPMGGDRPDGDDWRRRPMDDPRARTGPTEERPRLNLVPRTVERPAEDAARAPGAARGTGEAAPAGGPVSVPVGSGAPKFVPPVMRGAGSGAPATTEGPPRLAFVPPGRREGAAPAPGPAAAGPKPADGPKTEPARPAPAAGAPASGPSKFVPPHLRNKQ